jgi:CRISPR system Cascade subunit CasA
MTDQPFGFNLWHEPWIRVTNRDGTSAELGIGAALSTAHMLAALHDASPLVVAGVHRLLAAILQSIYVPQSLDDLVALLAAGRFDIARLEAFAAHHAARFDLFHPTAPFLQTGDVPLDGWRKPEKGQKYDWSDPKPIAALFAEVPVETNRAHFHHVIDTDHQVCPACCARGLLTIPAFASSGGAGIRPSINGVPPIYVLPAGATLFESLALSLVAPNYQPPTADPRRSEVAGWCGKEIVAKNVPISAVGYLESLTFPARRMRLYPRRALADCTHCGNATATVVRELLFEMGHWLSEGSAGWEDPFAAFRTPKGRSKGGDVGLKPIRPEAGKALWREYSGLLLAQRPEQFRPKVLQQIGDLIDRGKLADAQILRFRCIGIRTDGKAKIFEWLDEALEVPPALLRDPAGETLVEWALECANDGAYILDSTFDRHFRPERTLAARVDQRVVRFKTLRARMQATYWQRLAPPFRDMVFATVNETDQLSTEQAWADTLVKIGKQSFDEAANQVGNRADALRARVQAQDECRRRLTAKRKEWFDEQ